MKDGFPKAREAIEVFIRSMLPRAEMTWVGNEQLHVGNGVLSIRLPLNDSQLDDFETVLAGGQPVGYSNGLRSDLYLRIYVALGLEGMVPQWRITDILLKEEERDWATSLRVQTQFDAETAKALYDGLETLATSLKLTLKSDIDLPDVRAELGTVENLITYYEKQGHLNDRGAELGSLSYLKAAAVCWILKLEDAKAATSSPRARAAYDEKIFGVVQRFWVAEPMNRVEPPPALRDYIAQRNRASRATEPAHQPRFDIGPALEKLDPRLKARWEGGWAALRSEKSRSSESGRELDGRGTGSSDRPNPGGEGIQGLLVRPVCRTG